MLLKPEKTVFFTLIIMVMAQSCSGPASDQPLLEAEAPLYLEEHLDDARIEGSEVPEDIPTPVEWRFDEPQPEWKPVKPNSKKWKAVKTIQNKYNFVPSQKILLDNIRHWRIIEMWYLSKRVYSPRR